MQDGRFLMAGVYLAVKSEDPIVIVNACAGFENEDTGTSPAEPTKRSVDGR